MVNGCIILSTAETGFDCTRDGINNERNVGLLSK